jgi:group I intron endonuclease
LPSWVLNSPHFFLNVLDQRNVISNDLKYKSGIYCWYNLINGNYYIGSGLELRNRINGYFQQSYYRDIANLIIIRAILKYALGYFALIILEYTSKTELLSREQYWLDWLKPESNILERAVQ